MSTPKININFKAILIPCEEGGFTAVCPQIRGAISEGETEQEALENLVDAIEGVLATNAEIAESSFISPDGSRISNDQLRNYDLAVA